MMYASLYCVYGKKVSVMYTSILCLQKVSVITVFQASFKTTLHFYLNLGDVSVKSFSSKSFLTDLPNLKFLSSFVVNLFKINFVD